jgi:hypothetical protein
MTANGSGLASVATEAKARKSDCKIDSENNATAGMSQDLLIGTIKAHIAAGDKAKGKAEQHFLAAGLHLTTLKTEHGGTWAAWVELLTKVGISTGRASELMQLVDGRKTVEGLRTATAARNADLRRRKKTSSSRDEELATARKRETTTDDAVRYDRMFKRDEAIRKKKVERREQLEAEIERLASKLIELDRNTAHALHDLLWKDERLAWNLVLALARKLSLDDDEEPQP